MKKIPNKTKVRCQTWYGKFEGYVVCQNPESSEYLLRLDRETGCDGSRHWKEDWFPEYEKRDEKNCRWVYRDKFEVIEKPIITKKDIEEATDFSTFCQNFKMKWWKENTKISEEDLDKLAMIAFELKI